MTRLANACSRLKRAARLAAQPLEDMKDNFRASESEMHSINEIRFSLALDGSLYVVLGLLTAPNAVGIGGLWPATRIQRHRRHKRPKAFSKGCAGHITGVDFPWSALTTRLKL